MPSGNRIPSLINAEYDKDTEGQWGFIDQKFSRPPASTIRLACPYRYKHAGS